MVTLKHIAEHCEISIASVSKALNHMPGVGAKTAEIIRQTAREMGYLPNAAAQALKTNRSFNIGVLLEDDENHGLLHQFFVTVLEGFRVIMEAQGYDLMLMNHTVGKRRISYLEHCRHSNLDGIFVACIDFKDPELLELAGSSVPLVSIDHTYAGHPSVYSDNMAGMHKAVSYAFSRGHRRIAYVTGAPAGVTESRVNGYKKALEQLGLPFREEYLLASRYRDVRCTKAATGELLKLPEPPTCILMPDDYAALGGILAIEEAGLRVPEDVSIIGFDGLEFLDHISPRLTTVRQDALTIGEKAAELLLEHIERKRDIQEGVTVIVPVTLLEGATVAFPS
jgi:DNA-binding LacI/PurR family transcriptional regulator